MAGAPEKASVAEILRAIDRATQQFAGSSEIASDLPLSKKRVQQRLTELQNEGLIDRKRIGPAYAYWLTPEGERFLEEEPEH